LGAVAGPIGAKYDVFPHLIPPETALRVPTHALKVRQKLEPPPRSLERS
jgi:hypothetical protein